MGANGSGDSKLQHGENQWPSESDWAGAAKFVSRRRVNVTFLLSPNAV